MQIVYFNTGRRYNIGDVYQSLRVDMNAESQTGLLSPTATVTLLIVSTWFALHCINKR